MVAMAQSTLNWRNTHMQNTGTIPGVDTKAIIPWTFLVWFWFGVTTKLHAVFPIVQADCIKLINSVSKVKESVTCVTCYIILLKLKQNFLQKKHMLTTIWQKQWTVDMSLPDTTGVQRWTVNSSASANSQNGFKNKTLQYELVEPKKWLTLQHDLIHTKIMI